ncbi:MAG: hypothetical protein JWR19_4284 [Pedosphaera sp.]|nr:hypothetical protein [Pedosphaera sp.]
MSAKYSFHLRSEDRQRELPQKIIIGRQDTETLTHVALKFLAYLLFFRERLQIETNLHMSAIPFVPDLVQLDYELRPKLWVECGECSVTKLNKLAVKVPEAEIWIMKRSPAAAEQLFQAMAKEELRRDRYELIGLDEEMVDEFCGLLAPRNELLWVKGEWDPPQMQFDFNGLWFDAPFTRLRF